MAFTEAPSTDADGKRVRARHRYFKYVKRLPTGPKSANALERHFHRLENLMPQNKQIHLDNRPQGEATTSNFKLVTSETPPLQDGQVLVRHHFLSLDPYMRGRMNDAKSYAVPQPLGQVMGGGTVGEVVESRSPKYQVGDKVVGMGGWQEYSVANVDQPGALRKVDTTHVPLSHYLGAVGMPRRHRVVWPGEDHRTQGRPDHGGERRLGRRGKRVRRAGQGTRMPRGGIAGGPDKCKYAVEELGFDACIDYKEHKDAGSLSRALKEACPKRHRWLLRECRRHGAGRRAAAHERIRPHRLVRDDRWLRRQAAADVVSAIAADQPAQARRLHRQRTHGGLARSAEGTRHAGGTGKLRPRETIAQGIASAPEAFLGLLKGKNFGKQLVKLI
jgi:hypothetical protein